MFCWPTPQSRDRMYVVFWKKGNRAPDLEIRPPAWCPRCERNVEAVQTWKNPLKRWGRYKRQYIYCCPACTTEVTPYYYAAFNAIDWTIPAERIGDRPRPLKPRTLERVRYGLETYGRQPLQIITNMTTDGGRVRSLLDPGFTQTGSALAALVAPFLVETMFSHSPEHRTRQVDSPLPTQSTRATCGLVFPPAFLMTYRNYEGTAGYPVAGLDQPLRTIVTNAQERLILPPAFIARLHNRSTADPMTDPLGTICTMGAHHGLVINGAALLSLRDWRGGPLCYGLDDVLPTQIAAGQQTALVQGQPFLVQYNRTGGPNGMADPIPTVTSCDRQGLVIPEEEPSVEDCYFRMLQPPEIGAGMAFPPEYVVLGTKRDKVKQYGNAVTPPALEVLSERGIASLN